MEPVFEARIVDITSLAIDAIVNAANTSLFGGGGVDGAIHRRAGPGLLSECEMLPMDERGQRCPTGEARITRGYLLPCKYVIHTVGPVWDDWSALEADHLLAACYRSCMLAANTRGVASIAFPCISTGAFAASPGRGPQLAVSTTRQMCRSLSGIRQITFACFSEADIWAYRHHLGASA